MRSSYLHVLILCHEAVFLLQSLRLDHQRAICCAGMFLTYHLGILNNLQPLRVHFYSKQMSFDVVGRSCLEKANVVVQ